MATLLSGIELFKDLGVYSVIVPFILVVAVTYGFLSQFKPFGDNRAVNITISLMFGLIFISVSSAVRFISMMIPFVIVLFMLIILMLMIFKFAGADDTMIKEALSSSAGYGVIIGVLIIGIFVFISFSFPGLTPSQQPEAGSGDGSGGDSDLPVTQEILRETIFHPTIVGIIVMVVVFGAATYVVTSRDPIRK